MLISRKSRKVLSMNSSGFSLIEALIAIVIFVIGILGVYTLQINATQGNTLANRVSASANWSAYAIEEILGMSYDDLPVGGGGSDGLETMDGTADFVIYVQPDGSILKKGEAGAPGDPLYSVYYNVETGIADGTNSNIALNDVKIIRTHVVRNEGVGKGHLFSHTYYKAKWPESEE